jgi:hypothetical protein
MNRVNFLFISFLLFFLIPFPFRPFLFDPAIPRHVIRAQRDQEQQRRIEDESPLGRIQQLPGQSHLPHHLAQYIRMAYVICIDNRYSSM